MAGIVKSLKAANKLNGNSKKKGNFTRCSTRQHFDIMMIAAKAIKT